MTVKECHEYLKGLSAAFKDGIPPEFRITDRAAVRSFLKIRNTFSHKGDYGNCALIAGSKGMMGAAALSAGAFIHSGGGKLTCHIPEIGYNVLQISVPEAMVKVEPGNEHIESVQTLDAYDAVGIGPGLGQFESHQKLLDDVFGKFKKPLVIDADALNTIAKNKLLLADITPGSVLTPHAKEFERMFGKGDDELSTIRMALTNAARHHIVIVVKGPFTLVATPEGTAHFNSTGNPGMATGGAGDVLTGIITSLIGQRYTPQQAAILGVYLHGLAGDLAAAEMSQEAITAGDIVRHLGEAFVALHRGS